MNVEMVERAQGCLLGQFAGDALGSQVEFMSAKDIARKYPLGVREMQGGGTWNTLAGQPTDDSEMALLLARLLVRTWKYSPHEALQEYKFWLDSQPFDVGVTIGSALRGSKNQNSQANGALMRVSPLGIFGALRSDMEVATMARLDAALTHPHRACLEANALYAMAIAEAVRKQTTPEVLYKRICAWAAEMNCGDDVKAWVASAASGPPEVFELNAGWVKIAFWNALHMLIKAVSLEEALVETVGRGGDTDTNAAIAGALLGAVQGRAAIPDRWERCILQCRAIAGGRGVYRPRPKVFWAVDALDLGEALLGGPETRMQNVTSGGGSSTLS